MNDFARDNAALLLGTLVASAAAAFQFGYFIEVGLPFISYAGLQDWLVVAAATIPMAVPLPVLYAAVPGGFSHRRPLIMLAAIALAAPAVYLLFGFAYSLTLGVFLGAIVLISVLKDRQQIPSFSAYTLLFGSLGALAMCCYVGLLAGWLMQWSNCEVVSANGSTRHLTLLRALAEGHLAKDGAATVYLPKAEVKEIRCAWRGLIEAKGDFFLWGNH